MLSGFLLGIAIIFGFWALGKIIKGATKNWGAFIITLMIVAAVGAIIVGTMNGG